MPGTGAPARGDTDPQEDVGVLIVDDAAVFRSVASEVIRSTPGFWVMGEARSGKDAVELVTQRSPALVLMDVRMPGLGGVATARLIAQMRPTPITVLVSADEHPKIAADPRAHGAVAFLQKQTLAPAKLRELWAVHGPPAGAPDDEPQAATDISK